MASAIIEKSNNGLFNNEIELSGKYATIVRKYKDDVGLFATFRDCYMVAAILGFLHGRTGTEDNSPTVQKASIFTDQLRTKKSELRFLYRAIMLSKDESSFTIDDYMNRTFRDDVEDPEGAIRLKENMELFHSYVCGGLEFIDENFNDLTTEDAIADKILELVTTFASEVGLIEGEEPELPDFVPDFD